MSYSPESKIPRAPLRPTTEARPVEIIAPREPEIAGFDLGAVGLVARRQWLLMFLAVLTAVAAGLAFVRFTPKQYTATADVLIDKHSSVLGDQGQTIAALFDNEAQTMTQIELLQSGTIAEKAVARLHLMTDPDFQAEMPSAYRTRCGTASQPIQASGASAADPCGDAQKAIDLQRIVEQFGKQLSVTRAGQTYVLNVSFTAKNPGLAAKIANAAVDAFIDDQVEARSQVNKAANAWLQSRLQEVKNELLDADLAVDKFRQDNALQLVPSTVDGQEIPPTDKGAMANALEQYSKARDIMGRGETAVLASLPSSDPSFILARSNYLDALRREQDAAAKLGAAPEEQAALRAQSQQYQQVLLSYLDRKAKEYEGLLQLRPADPAANKDIADAAISGLSPRATSELNQLQTRADNLRSLYRTYLERFEQTSQMQSYPLSDARIITTATPPLKPSKPNKLNVLAAFIGGGLALGGLLAGLREIGDTTFRTVKQFRSATFLRCVGYAEYVRAGHGWPWISTDKRQAANSRQFGFAAAFPQSMMANSLNTFVAGLERRAPRGRKWIGVTSVLQGEGKSCMAVNFAQLLAAQGRKTLLVDGNAANPTLTRLVAGQSHIGAKDKSTTSRPIAELVLSTSIPGLDFLAAEARESGKQPSSPGDRKKLWADLADLATDYDYVIVDLPALVGSADVSALSPLVDAFLLVVRWGRTRQDQVIEALAQHEFIAGARGQAILAQTDMRRLSRYTG